jgi:hypothetical protein
MPQLILNEQEIKTKYVLISNTYKAMFFDKIISMSVVSHFTKNWMSTETN